MPDNTTDITGLKYCYRCFRPLKNCLCREAGTFSTQTEFIFLLHSKEARKEKTGTGRLAHLCLQNSRLFSGTDFSDDQAVSRLLHDPEYYPLLLFPGEKSAALTPAEDLSAAGKKLRLFVPDGTWTLVKRMIKRNPALNRLPQIRLNPPRPTRFVLKKEPDASCVSTIEAVYYFLEDAHKQGWETCRDKNQVLLRVLQKMVDFQLDCTRKNHSSGRGYK